MTSSQKAYLQEVKERAETAQHTYDEQEYLRVTEIPIFKDIPRLLNLIEKQDAVIDRVLRMLKREVHPHEGDNRCFFCDAIADAEKILCQD